MGSDDWVSDCVYGLSFRVYFHSYFHLWVYQYSIYHICPWHIQDTYDETSLETYHVKNASCHDQQYIIIFYVHIISHDVDWLYLCQYIIFYRKIDLYRWVRSWFDIESVAIVIEQSHNYSMTLHIHENLIYQRLILGIFLDEMSIVQALSQASSLLIPMHDYVWVYLCTDCHSKHHFILETYSWE